MIGIGITTKDRPRALAQLLHAIHRYTPEPYYVHVVNDGGVPIENWKDLGIDAYTENGESLGIPRAKNQNLAELMRHADCSEIFLFDDDTRPIKVGWTKIFTELPEPHAMYIFTGFGNQTKTIRTLGKSGNLGWYDHVRGCLLYYKREVIEIVGGFDPVFGVGMYEHTDLSDRIHAFGLTTHAYMAPLNGEEYIYCLDQNREIQSNFDPKLRSEMIRKNRPIKVSRRGKKIYVDYKEQQ